jgi:hypothetical protein
VPVDSFFNCEKNVLKNNELLIEKHPRRSPLDCRRNMIHKLSAGPIFALFDPLKDRRPVACPEPLDKVFAKTIGAI